MTAVPSKTKISMMWSKIQFRNNWFKHKIFLGSLCTWKTNVF